MLKNTKRIFALMIAVALVATSLFTGVVVSADKAGTIDLLEFGDYLKDMGSASIYYDTVLADNGETGDSWANAIIIDSAEEFVYLAKASGDDTAGKYYKVADGITGFDLSKGDLDYTKGISENLSKIQASGKNHSGNTPGFQGNFDGNGVTVYGAWCSNTNPSAYAGLFSCTRGDVTIKNVNVKLASFTATAAAGGIIGFHEASVMATVNIENCSVTDSYFNVTGKGYGTGVGAILGYGKSAPKDANGYVNVAYNINNCFVNLDENYFTSFGEDGIEDSGERVCHGGVAGVLGSNKLYVSNCIVIGITPYATMESTTCNDVQHSGLESRFTNVYTNMPSGKVSIGGSTLGERDFTGCITQLTKEQMKGTAAVQNIAFDWTIWMPDKNGYPELRVNHKNVSVKDNKDGTHAEVCECGFGGLAVEHTFVNKVCECGAELDCSTRKTISWEGAVASISTGSGTQEDPYIIKSAAELAWLVQQKANVTQGKYYKIDDAINAIVLQSADKVDEIKALSSSAEVKEYFENGEYISWKTMGWETSCFAGVLDGNGVTIYGIYAKTNVNAALFGTVDAGAVIKNLAVKNSYLVSDGNWNKDKQKQDYYQVAGIAGVTSSSGYGAKNNGFVWFDSCIVANNYMYNAVNDSNDRSGVIIGGSSDLVYIDNCLVYGNDATYGANVKMPVWACANNSVSVSGNAIKPEGLKAVSDGGSNPMYYNMVRNSIIFGATPYDTAQAKGSRFNDPKCFENVLTDADIANDKLAGDQKIGASPEQLTSIAKEDLASMELADAFIKTNTYPELKSFHDEIIPVSTNTTHTWQCKGCGLKAGVAEDHTFVLDGDKVVGDGTDEYKCSECGYYCKHNEQTVPTFEEGDCVKAAGTYARCKFCDWYFASGVGEASGHKLTYVEEDAGNCAVNGHLGYWECSVCNNKFATDDIWAPMNTALTDEELDLGIGSHIAKGDKNGVIVFYDKDGHWYECSVDDGRLDFDSNAMEDAEVIEHVFNKSFTCEDCGYVCVDHTLEVSKLVVVGDCFTAEESELKCKCGYKTTAVTKAAGHEIVKMAQVDPDDKMEGTKEHYRCNQCNAIFADAEGKTPITKASLIIRKTLVAEGDLLPNGDTSGKSPSTSDSFASVIAMAALSGTVLVLTKVKR